MRIEDAAQFPYRDLMRRRLRLSAALLALVIVAASCDSGDSVPPSTSETIRGSWLLVGATVDSQPYGFPTESSSRPANGVAPAVVRFGIAHFMGEAPCNDFQGHYALDDGTLRIYQMMQNTVQCADPAVEADNIVMGLFRIKSINVSFGGGGPETMQWTGGETTLTFRRQTHTSAS